MILNFTPPQALVILQAAQKLGLENRVKLWGCSTPCNTDFLAQSLGAKWNGKLFVNAELTPPDGTDTTADATKTCLINGGRVNEGIELEGSVNTVTGTSFEMAVNGQRASGPVTVDTSGASFSCAGVKGTCDATLLKTDARVHVRGTLTSCSMQAAQVKATEVKFQH